MAYVSRGVVTTTYTVFDSLNPSEKTECAVTGKIGPARLAARARKEFGPTAAITDIQTETVTYRMTLDDFIEHAEIVEE